MDFHDPFDGGAGESARRLDDAYARVQVHCHVAAVHIATGDAGARRRAIGQALAVLRELDEALDHERAPELCAEMSELYGYMRLRLDHAATAGDEEAIDEVGTLVGDLRAAIASAARTTN